MHLIPFYGIFNLSIGFIFVIIAVFISYITRQNFRDKEWHGVYSTLAGIIVCLVIGFYFIINALSIYFHSLIIDEVDLRLNFVQDLFYKKALYPYPFGSFVLFTILFFIMTIGTYAFWVNWNEKKGKILREPPKPSNPIDLEISRKMFHIAVIGILVLYMGIGEMVANNVHIHLNEIYSSENFPGTSFIPYYSFNYGSYATYMGRAWALFASMVILFLLLFTEFCRLYRPKYYLLKTISYSWRASEEKTLGPHVYTLLGCLIPILFFTPPIAGAAVAIMALGDGSATIIGITNGKHKIRPTSKKTWEGCFAGFIGAFVFSFLIYTAMINLSDVYGAFYQGTLLGGVVICLTGALTFFILDYASPPINDNIINPILCGLVMFLISFVIK